MSNRAAPTEQTFSVLLRCGGHGLRLNFYRALLKAWMQKSTGVSEDEGLEAPSRVASRPVPATSGRRVTRTGPGEGAAGALKPRVQYKQAGSANHIEKCLRTF